jgi:hypothetical protein
MVLHAFEEPVKKYKTLNFILYNIAIKDVETKRVNLHHNEDM